MTAVVNSPIANLSHHSTILAALYTQCGSQKFHTV